MNIKSLIKYLFVFLFGILITYAFLNTKGKYKKEASHTIAYGIKRLNKLVVAEQQFSNFYTHTSKNIFMLYENWFTESSIILKVDLKAQATYDLSKMKVEIDSINQIIKINEIPKLKIETFPDIEFIGLEQSSFNKFTKEDLNQIKKNATKNIIKKIDKKKLEAEAREQLIENLEEIYLLAKIYGWEIEDKTPYKNELLEKIKF